MNISVENVISSFHLVSLTSAEKEERNKNRLNLRMGVRQHRKDRIAAMMMRFNAKCMRPCENVCYMLPDWYLFWTIVQVARLTVFCIPMYNPPLDRALSVLYVNFAGLISSLKLRIGLFGSFGISMFASYRLLWSTM